MISNSEEETRQAGFNFAASLKMGQIVGLSGELGSGKTQFVKGLVKALGGAEEDVVSPTFSIVIPVRCKDLLIYHFDLYRLQNEVEMKRLIEEEFIAEQGIAVIEWFDKLTKPLVGTFHLLNFSYLNQGQSRRIEFKKIC